MLSMYYTITDTYTELFCCSREGAAGGCGDLHRKRDRGRREGGGGGGEPEQRIRPEREQCHPERVPT